MCLPAYRQLHRIRHGQGHRRAGRHPHDPREDPGRPEAHQAVLEVSNNKPKVGQTITLNGSASTDVDHTPIASYLFDCGNGTKFGPQTSPMASCTYTKAAKFTARLTVTDTIGLAASMSKPIQVQK